MSDIKIREKIIGKNKPLFFIAEAGVNHNGSLKTSYKMIDEAKKAGADAIKFQTFNTDKIILPKALKSRYHVQTTGKDSKQSWYDLLKSQEISELMHYKLINYCKKKKIIFLSTAYDEESADFLDKLGVPAFKIASTDNNNLPLVEHIAKKGKPMFISTAMSNIEEIKETIKVVKKHLNNKFVLMQCTGNYPSKLENSNLKVLLTYRNTFKCLYGYSDHTLEFLNPIAATAIGCSVYEKHFTLDKKMFGPDHRMSLLPSELKKTIDLIRLTEKSLGSEKKYVLKSEKLNRSRLKKSIVSLTNLKKGTNLKKSFFAIKRPGTGIPPSFIYKISQYTLKADLKKNNILKKNMIKKIKKKK